MTIPVLDISRFDHDRESFVSELGQAYQRWGFAGITQHGITHSTIVAALQAAEAFFACPDTVKNQYILGSGSARAYTPFGVEKAKDSRHSDLKEFYHIGRECAGIAHLQPNLWPSEVPAFEAAFKRLYRELDDLGGVLLQAMALHLGESSDYFSSKTHHGDSILRVLHYPPLKDRDVPNLRAAAHEDINLITLLAGSEQAGLEVLGQSGEWVPISMIEGTIICNVGDMLQRLTNGRLRSTTHRVVNPKGELARASRYSIPFFVHPNPDMSLAALAQCVGPGVPAPEVAVTAGDFLDQRLHEIGLKN